MKISIQATDQVTHIDGVKVRLWEGITERGTRCKVFIHRIAVHESQDATQFDVELQELLPPGRVVSSATRKVFLEFVPASRPAESLEFLAALVQLAEGHPAFNRYDWMWRRWLLKKLARMYKAAPDTLRPRIYDHEAQTILPLFGGSRAKVAKEAKG